MPFRRGPDINPFAGSSQEPMHLLEEVTALELASAVPYVKITKIDFRTGRADPNSVPLMYDLVRPPSFADFGTDADSFLERSVVSFNSMTAKSQMPNGDIMYREVTLRFTVHQPRVVFDRSSPLAWREILEEGNSFALEYGWRADPTVCRNPLFNGYGHVTPSGVVIGSQRATLMYVYRWNVSLGADGQVDVTVDAMENGDLALRDARFSDAFEETFGRQMVWGRMVPASDASNVSRLKGLLDKLVRVPSVGRGDMVTMGDVLDSIVAPMVEKVMRSQAGYASGSPVELLLGNFNLNAGPQSAAYGGKKPVSIGDFVLPLSKLKNALSQQFSQDRAMTLQNFIRIIIGIMNSPEGWGPTGATLLRRPVVGLKLSTVQTGQGFRFVFALYDRRTVADTTNGLSFLRLDRQSQAEVRKALSDAGVPMIEFAKAGSAILDASFEMQPNPMLQSIQIEGASDARKDRVQTTEMPDVESRRGQALPKDIVPISILEGDVTMLGNFIFDPPSRVWVDFFGSRSISGIFNVMEQVDTLEPGKFETQYKLISEGIDPLNTRQRLTDAELDAAKELARKTRKK